MAAKGRADFVYVICELLLKLFNSNLNKSSLGLCGKNEK